METEQIVETGIEMTGDNAADADVLVEGAEPSTEETATSDDVETSEPEVETEAAEPEVETDAAEPEVETEAAEPEAETEAAEPDAETEAAEPDTETAEAAEPETETAEAETAAGASEADADGAEAAGVDPDNPAGLSAMELAQSQEGMAWYVVHTYSGYEQKARLALEERITSLDKVESFGRILVPEEQVVERTKTGKTRNVSKRFFPGYMLVEMDLNNETWHVVKDTPRVTGFVGGSNRKPSKVPPQEVARILGQMKQGAVETKPLITFDKGESIRVVDGPFANFIGVVDEVRPEKAKLRVMVSIFGRATPVELDYMQVEKD